MTANGSTYLDVELQDVHLRLDGHAVLRGVDWRIAPGEHWVLMGANGSGKTQLLKLIAGDVWPTPGARSQRLYGWRGERFDEPYGVKQEISYVGAERQDRYEHYECNHSAAAIVGTGLYRTDIPLDRLTAADRHEIAVILERLSLTALARRRFLSLSYGERRLVLLARAWASRPRLLLLDELFNGLDAANHARAGHFLQTLARLRLPWVLATHRPEDIPPSATHLAELSGGRLQRRALSAVRRAAARGCGSVRPRRRAIAAGAPPGTEPLLRVRRVSVWLGASEVLAELSFQVHRGECWVVHGHNGSGKSTLLRALYGDISAARGGEIVRAGLGPGVPVAEFKQRVGFVAPELQAAHPLYLSAEEVVASGLHSSIGLHETFEPHERARARLALRQLGAAALARRRLRALSYGQFRRVLFARALVHGPTLLLLDEPFAGLDAHTRHALAARVEAATRAGVTVVMATHHRDEWPATATHELQLTHGRMQYCGPVRRSAIREKKH
jgi:molybdate transport system ATP-binding protein